MMPLFHLTVSSLVRVNCLQSYHHSRMGAELYLWMVALCLFFIAGRSEEYCISPIQDNSSSCNDINEYALFNLQSNTTFYFTNGSHELNYHLHFENVVDITLVGTGGATMKYHKTDSVIYYEPFSRIVCTSPLSGISFINVTNMVITNITFVNCGSQIDENSRSAAIYLFSTYDFVIEGVSIQNATGYGILYENPSPLLQYDSIVSSSYIMITRSSFIFISSAIHSSYSLGQLIISDCAFVNIDHGITMVNGSSLAIQNCIFYNSNTSITAMSDLWDYFWVELQLCSFINSGIGCNAVGNVVAYLQNCTFFYTTTAISAEFGRFYCIQCLFENCTTGIDADLMFFLVIVQSNFENVKMPMHLISVYAVLQESYFNNHINGGMYIYSLIIIRNCKFSNSRGSSIYSLDSDMYLKQNVSFSNGYSIGYGGALYLSASTITLIAPVSVSFINNTAQLGGGAIYSGYENNNLYCFFVLRDTGTLDSPGIQLYFEKNSAREAGNDLYASLNCTPNPNSYTPFYNVQNKTYVDIVRALITSNASIGIAADPLIVCVSSGTLTYCSNNQSEPFTVLLRPGQTKTLLLSTLDEYNGMTPSLVFFIKSDGTIYDTVRTKRSKTDYIIENVPNATFSLVPQVLFISGFSYNDKMLQISILDTQCPRGFTLNAERGACECNILFKQQNVMCNISDTKISKPLYSWIGNASNGAFLFYETCSLEYCNQNTTVELDSQDEQCSNNHSGVLCGGCTLGYSEVFGGALCQKCSDMYLFLLIPFAAMGAALVAFLVVLNLTVSSGTLNGFIFYANIIKINDEIFRPTYSSNTVTTVLSAFISWLNLDLGVVTCFYNGMSMHSKTWLQFAFPAYIFMLVGAIIVAGRWSARISRLCRHNVVPVLATLILMSYAKLLKTSINIFARAAILVEQNNLISYINAWRYNGNIGYLGNGHLELFIAATLIVVLFIVPYTLLMLLSSCIQAKSQWRIFCWFNKLKPFIDCYEGPYISRHRFWTGFLLLIRVPIYVTTAVVEVSNNSINLILTIFIAMSLVIYLDRFGVYKKWQYCLLEMFLYINLAVLFLLTLFFGIYKDTAMSPSSPNALLASYSITVGSALILFLVIVFVKVYNALRVRLQFVKAISVKEPQISNNYVNYELTDDLAPSNDDSNKMSDDDFNNMNGYREELLSPDYN